MWKLLSWNDVFFLLEVLTWIKGHRMENGCRLMEGPRRFGDIKMCAVTFILQCWKSLNLWTVNLTLDTEAQDAHMKRHPLNTSKGPCGYPTEFRMCTLAIFMHLYTHYTSMTFSLPTFHLRVVLVLHPDLTCFFHVISRPVSLSPSLSLCLATNPPTHPSIHQACWHTNTVFRKQNNPGNMTGIWKRLISLGGWVSNPPANDRGRERKRARETVEEHCVHFAKARWWGQLWCCTASQAVTHTHAQTWLPQPVCTAAVYCVWWPKRVRLIRLSFYLSLRRYPLFSISMCCWD